MNVKEVDFERLIENIEDNCCSPSKEDVELADRILFGYEKNNYVKSDFIFVAGNPKCLEDRIIKGAELMEKGFANKIILSGGVLIPGKDKTEAQAMEEYCIGKGLDSILVENESTTTTENIKYTAKIIENSGIESPSIIAVTSAHHMRRVLMDFEKQKGLFPDGTKIFAAPSVHPDCDPEKWHESPESVFEAIKELGIIAYYLFFGNYDGFQI